MSEWDYINGTSLVFTLGGDHKPYSKAIETERWFMDKEIYQYLDQIRCMIYHECINDFLSRKPEEMTKYRVNISIEKIEGAQYGKIQNND